MAYTISNRTVYKDLTYLNSMFNEVYNLNIEMSKELKKYFEKRLSKYPKVSDYEGVLENSKSKFEAEGGVSNKLDVSEKNLDLVMLKHLISQTKELIKRIDKHITNLENNKYSVFGF